MAAVFGFIATIVMGLNQQLRLNDRLSENQKCLGRLSALDFSITSGSQNWAEITREYAEILRSYSGIASLIMAEMGFGMIFREYHCNKKTSRSGNEQREVFFRLTGRDIRAHSNIPQASRTVSLLGYDDLNLVRGSW